MKKTFIALTLLALFSSTAVQATEPTDHRRTAFIPFGQKMLVFEAPTNMCFLDETNPAHAAFLSGMKAHVAAKGQQVLMAVFADCYQMSGLGETADPLALPDLGSISWMNPYIGEKASMPASDYFGMRMTSMPQYVANNVKDYPDTEVDAEPKRSADGVSLAYTSNMEIEYQKFTLTGVTAAMLVEGYPVDVTLTHTSKTPITQKARLYALMDKFLAQNATLNKTQ